MNSIYKYILAAVFTVTCTAAMGQALRSAYYTNDFKNRHEMNPAFANDQNYFSVPGIGNVNVSTMGNFGYEDIVLKNPMYSTMGGKRMTTFMNPYISNKKALDGFSSGDNKVTGNIDLSVFSAGFKAWGGYNTVELNVRSSFGLSVPYEFFEFAKNTGNRKYNIGDIEANAMGYVELALGHSRNINDKLRVGGKVKFLLGGARADLKMEDMSADLTAEDKWLVRGKVNADVSMKGFEYVSKTKDYQVDGRGQYEYVSDVDVDGAGIGGFGMAFDLGAVYKINEDWTVNAALLDLGFMHWSDCAKAVNRCDEFLFDGFRDMSVTSAHGTTIDGHIDRYEDQIKDFINVQDQGNDGGRTTGIGATLNVGCEYNLPVYRKITFGALSSTRFYGKFTWTEGRVSANWTPLKWLDGGVNFAVNSLSTSMGWVLNIHPKGYNFFVGMDRLLGKQSKEFIPLNSNLSLAMGMSITW